MDFYNKTGKMAIGSRLRLLTDKVTTDAAQIYKLYDVDLQPKWFPVFYTLCSGDSTITEIAQQIGHSHPSVSKIVGEMLRKGVVSEKTDKADKRRNVISLSKKGKTIAASIQDQYKDVNEAIEEMLTQTTNNLWKAIEEWEILLDQKNLLRRVQEKKKVRESKKVKIVDYTPAYAKAFKELNKEWISTYFKMEPTDFKSLENPKGYILDKGGAILVALYEGEPVGVCALIKMNHPEYSYELAKMAVSPKAQGKNIGYLLGKAILKKAKALGGSSVYLESNTILKPAISLYYKLGFQKTFGEPSPYERCNIQMAVKLK